MLTWEIRLEETSRANKKLHSNGAKDQSLNQLED
jgi:hypothetical protein